MGFSPYNSVYRGEGVTRIKRLPWQEISREEMEGDDDKDDNFYCNIIMFCDQSVFRSPQSVFYRTKELFLLFYENYIVINLATYRKIFWDYYNIEHRKRDSKLCHKLITTGTVIVRIILLWFKRKGKFNFIRDFHL